jgi:hypothetical protein
MSEMPRDSDEPDFSTFEHSSSELGGSASRQESDDLPILRDLTSELLMAQEMQRKAPPKLRQEPPKPPPVSLEEPEPEPPAAPPAPEEQPAEVVDERANWFEARVEGPRSAGAKPRPAPRAPEPPFAALIATISAGALWAAATFFSTLRVEPVHTWYYLFAWYPFLLIVNFVTSQRTPGYSLFFGRWRTVLHLMAWSMPMWLVFEMINFRIENWYYVGVPANIVLRRIGVALSFATVLPGVLLLEECLRVRRVFQGVRTPEIRWTTALDRNLLIAGGVAAALVLALPTFFFPLVWAIPVLLLEPWLRRSGGASLARDLADGRPGRVLRLLVAGMICGVVWEAANAVSGGRWIYTVPGLSATAPFEMPLLGFVGFAPFALCLWSMARALVRLGLLPDWERPGAEHAHEAEGIVPPAWRNRAKIGVAVLSLVVLQAMDWLTVDSFTVRARDIPGVPDGVPEYARHRHQDSAYGVLRLIEAGDLYIPGGSTEMLMGALGEKCRLILFRGVGAANARRLEAVGVSTIEQLAVREPEELIAALAGLDEPGWWPRERRVRGWIEAARREVAEGRPSR